MVVWLERGVDLHTAQLMPLPLASVKSRLVLPFWYRLTCVFPEKGPLNGCVCVSFYRNYEAVISGSRDGITVQYRVRSSRPTQSACYGSEWDSSSR